MQTTEVARLEVEVPPDGLVNLIANPDGALGSWGWETPVAGATITTTDTYGGMIKYTSSGVGSQFFYSTPAVVNPGEWIAARWRDFANKPGSGDLVNEYDVSIEFLDSARNVVATTPRSSFTYASVAPMSLPASQIPAAAVYARLRFDQYGTGRTVPAADDSLFVFELAMAASPTQADLFTIRRNLIVAPTFQGTDWPQAWSPLYGALMRQGAQGAAELESAGAERDIYVSTATGYAMPVTGGQDYAAGATFQAATVSRDVHLTIRWLDAAGNTVGESKSLAGQDNTTATVYLETAATAPSAATQAHLQVRIANCALGEVHWMDTAIFESAETYTGAYFDGDTTGGDGWTYSWTGTQYFSPSQAETSNLAYIEPVEYRNIMGPAHEVRVNREGLNVGTLTATVLDATLSPAEGDAIRPGRKARLTVLDGEVWRPLFTGTVTNAQVTYDPADTSVKRARVELTATDHTTTLANTAGTQGVEKIVDLPHILEPVGIPWDVNGSGGQVASANVVAVNENASVLDQVAITRDTALGYAWVNAQGVLCAYDATKLDPTVVADLDETVCSDMSIDYNTADCINEVTVKWLRYNPDTGETTEVSYGPYRDAASIREWGPRAAEFTIQGAAESPLTIETYAGWILDANANPVVRVNSVSVPIRDAADLPLALLDLYDLVRVTVPATGAVNTSRITSVEHTIAPGTWSMTVGFTAEGAVALPQVTPAPPIDNVDGVTTVSKLLIDTTTDANASAGNKPPLRVGDPTGNHLRIDGNEIISMSSDTAQGSLLLNRGGSVEIGGGRNISGIDFGATTLAAGNGEWDVPHALGVRPTVVLVTALRETTIVSIDYGLTDANTFHVNGWDAAGSGSTETRSLPVHWIAIA